MMRWNLGCGTDVKDGYVNVDLKEGTGIEKKDIVRFMKSQPDETTDEIMLYDIIEHFPHGIKVNGTTEDLEYQPKFVTSLKLLEMAFEKLRPGGELRIRVPDIMWIMEKCISGEFNWDRMVWTVFGEQNEPIDSHQTAWTEEKLNEVLNDIGYIKVKVTREEPNLVATARKPE